jgi:type III secretory pathway component EscT
MTPDVPTGLDALIPTALSMVRVGVALSVLPLGHKSSAGKHFTMPMSLAIALCVPAPVVDAVQPVSVALLAIKEGFLGAALGFLLSRIFFVVGGAGAILDQQAGYTVGSTFNPTFGTTAGPIETIFTALLTLMLVDGNGGFVAAKALAATYDIWPVARWLPPGSQSLQEFATHLLSDQAQLLLEMTVRIVAPMAALLLLADICTAIAGRYAQQLNPFSISLALKAFVVAVILGVMMRSQAGVWWRMLKTLTIVS